jgi:hypothetical protein
MRRATFTRALASGIVLATVLTGCGGRKDYALRDQYGGCPAIKGDSTGFFHAQKIDERWYLVDPLGNGYILAGMTSLGNYPEAQRRWRRRRPDTTAAARNERRGDRDTTRAEWREQRRRRDTTETPLSEEHERYRTNALQRYPTREDWRRDNLNRLKTWAFNCIMDGGAERDSGVEMPYVILSGVSGGRRADVFKDVFSEAFERQVTARMTRTCGDRVNDPRLIGYFTDNELPWAVFWGGGMLDFYLSLPDSAPGARVAIDHVKERYDGSIEAFNRAWATDYPDFEAMLPDTAVGPGAGFEKRAVNADRDSFLYEVAKRYYGFIYRKVKELDPNHMVLGTRFLTGDLSLSIARGMKGNVDAISCNAYLNKYFPAEMFSAFSETADAPIILSEFGYRAKDAGIPVGGTGAIPRVVDTQQDRADKYQWYVTQAVSQPYIVGYIWWWYQDGWGGENVGNYGFIDWSFEPYQVLADRAARVNGGVYRTSSRRDRAPAPVPLTTYTIRTTAPLVMDGSPRKYPQADIVLDHTYAYQGHDFESSGFGAKALVLHDNNNLYVAATVTDRDVKEHADDDGVWAVDGMEFHFGHYQGAVYFQNGQVTYTMVRADPFPGMEVAGNMLEGGYFLEVKIPKAQLADVIEGGRVTFAVGVNDGEGESRFRQIYFPRSYEWMYHESFATGVLAD